METLIKEMKLEEKLLSIYRSEFQLIENARIEDSILFCTIKKIEYPYTKNRTFEYITSVTVTLILCQLVYVLIGKLIESKDGEFRNYTLKEYSNMIDETSLKFISHSIRYKKPIPIDANPIACCQISGTKQIKKFKIYEFSFEIGDRAILGTLKAMKV